MAYTKQEVDEIIVKNNDKIVTAIEEAERDYANWGIYNKHDTIVLFFDLSNEEIYEICRGHGYSQDIYDKVNNGEIVGIYELRSGDLGDSAKEGADYDDDFRAEVEKETDLELKNKIKNKEINEDEYDDYYNEIYEETWERLLEDYVEEYIENYIKESCPSDIEIDYKNALGKEEDEDEDYYEIDED